MTSSRDSVRTLTKEITSIKNEISNLKKTDIKNKSDSLEDRIIADISDKYIAQTNNMIGHYGSMLSFIQWTTGTIGVLFIILGIFGVKQFNDIIKIKKELKNEMSDFENLKEKSQGFLANIHLFNEGLNLYQVGKIDACINSFKEIEKDNYFVKCYIADAEASLGNFDKSIGIAKESICFC